MKKEPIKMKKEAQWLYDMQGRIVGYQERIVMSYKKAKELWGDHPNFPKNKN